MRDHIIPYQAMTCHDMPCLAMPYGDALAPSGMTLHGVKKVDARAGSSRSGSLK